MRAFTDRRNKLYESTKEETAYMTAVLESMLLTLNVDAHEKRDTEVADIPGDYPRTKV